MQFTQVTYTLSNLMDSIEIGTIGLPEIQRPFVWKATKVRDLVDSMYRGFPVGFLLFWENLLEPGARQIGADGKQLAPRMLVVDGQQRLTSLFAVMKGQPVLTSDFKETRLYISFRPLDGRFEVTSAAMKNDPEWIPDISRVWREGLFTLVGSFVERLRASRDVAEEEEKGIGEAIQRLHGISNFQFTALELASSLEEEQVAEIFVRINSEGVRLNQADFILTLMSVWWDKGRRELEDFCRASRNPSDSGASPFNWFIKPSPDQLLRVGVALAFRRARLQHVYSILRGKDLQTGVVSPERRDQQFDRLREAQETVLDLTNWHEFFKAVTAAGYRGGRVVISETNLMYTYAMYLIGRRDFGLDHKKLRQVIARWFFMTSITSRYTGSSETQMEADLNRVGRLRSGEEFVAELDRICDGELTNDYWEIRLPNDLERSGTRSPTLFGFDAALCLLDANALFSNLKVHELIDPAITGKKSAIERHHLFPKSYLKSLGVQKTSEVNQIANYALVEWNDNIAIGADAPADYYPEYAKRFSGEQLDKMTFFHALPEGWHQMAYRDFLEARREAIAEVVRSGWGALRPSTIVTPAEGLGASLVRAPEHWRIDELISRNESDRVEFKSSARWSYHRGERGPEIEDAIVKTVAAFMNTRGGTLIIGVDDDGHVVGLEKDLTTVRNGDLDGLDQWLHRKLGDAVGVPEVAELVSVSFVKIDGQDLCRVDVKPSAREVFARSSKDDEAFYVRTGAATRQLSMKETQEYVRHHWDQKKAVPLVTRPSTPVVPLLDQARSAPPIPVAGRDVVEATAAGSTRDWSDLHEILHRFPSGRWTTYGDLAAVIDTSAQAVGNHLPVCSECEDVHRVLTAEGRISDGFQWPDSTDVRDPRAVLEADGVHFEPSGSASEGQRMARQELWHLFEPALDPQPTQLQEGSGAGRELFTRETILEALDVDAVDTARRLLEDWEVRPSTWTLGTKDSLVLYASNDRVEQGRCHVGSLFPTGRGHLVINPGRIADSGAFGAADLDHLHRLIRQRLPTTITKGKGYYLHFELPDVDPDEVSEIFDFVLSRLRAKG